MRSPLTTDRYLALYLDEGDISEMRLAEDVRFWEWDDAIFAEHGGVAAGHCAWTAQTHRLLGHLLDCRFVFGTEEAAAAYHRRRLIWNSDGCLPLQGAPRVGAACVVFGGVPDLPVHPRYGQTLCHYVFRVHHVLVRISGVQLDVVSAGTLTAADIAPLARRAEARVRAQIDDVAH